MKRLVSWLLTLCLVFSMMPTASFAECSHENLTMTYDPKIERYYVDENTHYTEATVYNVCKDCGESVTYTSPMGYSSHEYVNGVCKCGAVQPTSGSLGDLDFDDDEEEHTHSWEEVDRESVYEYYNEKYHREESVIVYYECECGAEKEKTKSGDGSKEQHRFNSRGVCKVCGYEEEEEDCSHKNLSLKYDPQYSYEVVDETYHHTYVTLYYKCDDCGEEVQKTQDSGNGKHWFENGKCAQCGYKESTSSSGAAPNPTLRGFDTPEPTATPTVKPTATPTTEPTLKPIAKPTAIPTSTPHICIAGTPSHWYGVYDYYDEEQHTRHHVVTTYCIECGKELAKTNELEYVEHVFEDGRCEKCGWQCVHASTRDEIGTTPVGYVDLGREYHLLQYPVEQICNVCNKILNTRNVGQDKTKHVFSNGYCKYCGYEEPLFSPDELPTGRYINEELDSRFDYFTENIQGRGAQNILTRLIEEIETMEENAKSSDAYRRAKKNALELMYQLKNSYEYQCNVKVSDAYEPYYVFMNFVDDWATYGIIDKFGAYDKIETDPGFCKMVDVALNSYEITSETFKPALAYAKSFNKVLTCDLIGVVDIGIVAGLATEIAVSGVSTIRNLDSAKKVMAKNGNYSSEAAEHIFKGNKSGGFHYEGLNDASSRVVEVTRKNANGVYEAYVEINGKIKKKPSTFFPKSWTPDQVLNSINKVYETGAYDATKNIITGKFKGVDIWINLDKAGKIISAFPVIP